MGNKQKSLVDLYPELFEVQPSAFFDNEELKRTLKAARELYSRNYCETVLEESDYSKEDALNLKEVLEEDFREGVKWGAFVAFCEDAEEELEKE